MANQSPSSPPRFSEQIIEWLCREELVEEILGNLHEYHLDLQKQSDGTMSRLAYWYQVITYLRPSTLKRISTSPIHFNMFHFNLRIAVRNLWKNRTHTFLNLAGFTLGMVCFILLYFHIRSEFSHDNFHSSGDQIYRVLRESGINNDPYKIGVTSAPFARALPLDFPNQITSALRVAQYDQLVRYEDKAFHEERFSFADSNFFDFFDFPLIAGDPATALKNLNSVVLTEEMAKKYFGEEDPIGKLLEVDDMQFEVKGILGKAKAKSHLELDFIASLGAYHQARFMREWWWNSLNTYVKIPTPEEAAMVEAQFPQFMDKYFGDDFEESGNRIDLLLEPLRDIYFNHDIRYDSVKHGNKNSIYILIAVAISILLIAAFNYLNLSITTTYGRAKEAGLRKVMGSNVQRLILQFLGEAFLIIAGAFFMAVAISMAILPFFNQYFQLEVPMNWSDPNIWLFFSSLTLVMMLLSGLYPALLFASFQPVETLKGKLFSFGRSLWMRKGLVVAQFVIAIFMIISTLLISKQITYVQNKDLGFDQEAVVLIEVNNQDIRRNIQLFRDQLNTSPHTISTCATTGEPGGFHDATTVQVRHMEAKPRLRTVFTDQDYLPTFDIELLAGRNFSKDHSTDLERTAILNKSAARELGWTPDEAINQPVFLNMFDSLERTIIGVVADYHFSSLKDQIEPLIISYNERNRQIAIKLQKGHISEGLMHIQKTWEELAPNNPFAYRFLDQKIAQLYEQEQKQHKVFSAFAAISIFLACLGVFGLISHATLERKKEFNIRKVLGARVDQILVLIYREFMLLLGIATLLAIPTSWLFINDWLADFAYHIQILDYWYLFLLGGMLTFLIAIVTMSFRAIGAAMGDPAEGLRYE